MRLVSEKKQASFYRRTPSDAGTAAKRFEAEGDGALQGIAVWPLFDV
jgi:hypothetical protein